MGAGSNIRLVWRQPLRWPADRRDRASGADTCCCRLHRRHFAPGPGRSGRGRRRRPPIIGPARTSKRCATSRRIPDHLISREAGVQTSSLSARVNGAGTTVDMRGFGVTGPSNTLILLNGRRLNDWDLPGFDLSTIDRKSIERIEITRGNSGAVLYGDGAVGGVINIVTRTGAGVPPSARLEGGLRHIPRASKARCPPTPRPARFRRRSTATSVDRRLPDATTRCVRETPSATSATPPTARAHILNIAVDDQQPGLAGRASHRHSCRAQRIRHRSAWHQHAPRLRR